ncbi:MAG TPA: hypothetical protein VK609_12185 [Mucilaginibacter sp.]|nr:hypothetical protein [Mucilaginibacter sp.]
MDDVIIRIEGHGKEGSEKVPGVVAAQKIIVLAELGAGITLVAELMPKEKRKYATTFLSGKMIQNRPSRCNKIEL